MFQSAPLAEARGDKKIRPDSRSIPRFNPLPPPKQGEMVITARIRGNAKVSIRSPRRSKGRCEQRRQRAGHPGVSIRSPRRSKGRSEIQASEQEWDEFQSAPLAEARGDARSRRIPILPLLFQSAPLAEARGDEIPSVYFPSIPPGFNPLPSPKQGEIDDPPVEFDRIPLFQSAPLAEARGDICGGRQRKESEMVSIRSPRRSKGRWPAQRDRAAQRGVSIRSPRRSKGRCRLP